MEIALLYEDIVWKLKNNQRPKVELSKELIAELKDYWSKAINQPQPDEEALTKIFCILDNTYRSTNEFTELFEKSFPKLDNPEQLIFILAASKKHIIEESLKSGEMIPSFYFLELKKLLQNKNAEVLEWTLRTIESMGPMSLRLKHDIKHSRPGFMKFLNQHQKAAAEIIDLLERQWKAIDDRKR